MKILKFKYLILVFTIVSAPAVLSGQKRGTPPKLEDLPRIAMDTLDTADRSVKVIVYTNNTWEYYYPGEAELLDKAIFNDHWDTSQIFAYRSINLSDLPQTIELNLVDGLGKYHSPIVGRVSSKYGPRGRKNHNGTDISLKTGEPIYATFGGKVRYAQSNSGGFGNLVIIRHENGLETWYAHLSRCNVEVNDYVTAGAVIGFGGNTGKSNGSHLHYEIRYCDQTFDPERLIDFSTGDLRYMTFALEKSYFNIHSRASETLDEDFEGTVLAADGTGELTSEEILENIEANAKAQQAKQKAASGPKYHSIKRGDTLGKIAARYGTSISKLCQLNNITRTTIIKAGSRLRIR
jgi:murein DD-endopeptidase MepM/ murein hydrolase activator NlpD